MPFWQKVLIFGLGALLGVLLLRLFGGGGRETAPRPEYAGTLPPNYYPQAYTDAYRREVRLVREPRRVVSLAPSVTETLVYVGAGLALVGRTEFCTLPEALAVPSIGGMTPLNLEAIIGAQPQFLVGTTLTPLGEYARLDELRLPAVALSQGRWTEILQETEAVGRLLGANAGATRLVRALEGARLAVERETAAVRTGPPRRVLFLYDLDGLHSAGAGSWLDDLLRVCHAENVAAGAPSAWPTLSREGLLALAPEVLLVSGGHTPAERAAVDRRVAGLTGEAFWRQLPAVRDGRVTVLPGRLTATPGPALVETLPALARAIWPEAYSGSPGEPGNGAGGNGGPE